MGNTNNSNIFKVIGAIVIVGLVAFFGLKMKDGEQAPINKETATPVTNEYATPAPTSKYKDGTYSADGSYVSPAGVETVTVTLTLKDDVVTNAEFTGNAVNPTSKLVQAKFATGFEILVKGLPIDEVSLTVVNGSSLTPKGFMDALAKIKLEANATL